MPKPFFVFLAAFGVCAAVIALDTSPESRAAKANTENAKPADKPAFVPTPSSDATPEPKSPSVLQRLFGSRQGKKTLFPTTPAPSTPQPEPTPVAKAKPTVKKTEASTADTDATPKPKKRKSKPKAPADETDSAIAKADTPEAVKPAPERPETPAPSTPVPGKKNRKGKAVPVVAAKNTAEPPADADPETKEKFRFDQAKAKASEDPEVKELKAKVDGAATDDEARSAQRAYNKALFNKMKKIDGSIEERINQMETAILKRLDEK